MGGGGGSTKQFVPISVHGPPNIFNDDGWATKHTNKVCA